jgi:ABC-type Fe3+-hydroxamate transport system substrate-binding protein
MTTSTPSPFPSTHPSFPYWETLSFEKADTYQPDLLLFDGRNDPQNFDLLKKQPIAKSIKAFAAGAYVQWPPTGCTPTPTTQRS